MCCYAPRFLFEPILKDLLGMYVNIIPNSCNKFKLCILLFIEIKQNDKSNQCDNFMKFVSVLKQAQIQNERVIIVLDKCELLEHEQIIIFSKLQELIKSHQFCVVFISQVSSAKFNNDINFLPIEFEQYNSGKYYKL